MRLRDQQLLHSTSLTRVKFVHLNLSICTFFERVGYKTLLGYPVAKHALAQEIQPGSPDYYSS